MIACKVYTQQDFHLAHYNEPGEEAWYLKLRFDKLRKRVVVAEPVEAWSLSLSKRGR
ncbi:MAG: hypothetical protein ACYC3P_01370 [Bellilinea sp.]